MSRSADLIWTATLAASLVSCSSSHETRTVEEVTTEVLVLGMIHSGHKTSESYGLDTITELVRAIDPDDICVEIPPDRWPTAKAQLDAGEPVTEPRTSVFPEYVSAIFPLMGEMGFTIVPTAGWTREMADARRAKLQEIENDPARAEQWAEHELAIHRMGADINELGAEDDPRVIHSSAYDDAIKRGYGGPYNTYFNDELGDGGWDNINAKHYGHIADHLDSVRGQGRRVLVTYGAAHKYWFLEQLRERDDVVLIDVSTFLDATGR